MRIDPYTKALLTVIAAALTLLAANPWLTGDSPLRTLSPRSAAAQLPLQPPPPAFTQWWDDCVAVSKETVPASWGTLVTATTGAFVFVTNDTIRLARFAPFEVITPEAAPGKKPCKVLEIRRGQ